MSLEDTLRNTLDLAVYAPSGDNSQPWAFSIEGGVLYMFNKPESDPTLYNFKQRGSYVAHGAVVENVVLLMAEAGYEAHVTLFPGVAHCTAKISFVAAQPRPTPLVPMLTKRVTNRKPYTPTPLLHTHTNQLATVGKTMHGASFCIIEDSARIQKLGKILSLNEQLLMQNRSLHDFLFSIIRWTRDEELKNPGLYISTMELPLPVRFLFKYAIRFWGVVRILNYIGFPYVISSQTASLYGMSGAIGVITVDAEDDEHFIAAGRVLQRVWLTATSLGISVQPVTAIPYLAQRVRAGEADAFSKQQQDSIRVAEEAIRDIVQLHDSAHVAMILRMGYGEQPTAQSVKMSPHFQI